MRRAPVFPLLFLAATTAFAQPAPDPLPEKVASLNERIRRTTPSAGLFSERSAAMRELIRRDPARALEVALPDEALTALRRAFPARAAELETRGEWSGTITEGVEDDFERHQSRSRWWLHSGKINLDLRPAGPVDLRSGEAVRVQGLRLGSVVATTGITREAAAVAETFCGPTGEQKIAVLLTTYPGVTPPAYNQQAIQQMFFGATGLSLTGYWKEASYGKTWATGDVFGPLMLDRSYVCEESTDIEAATLAAAAAKGLDLTPYQRIFVIFPGSCSSWGGLSSLGCGGGPTSFTWIPFSNAYWATAAHEGGHTLGVRDAMGRAYPGTPLGAPYDSGTRTMYADPFTMMSGYSRVHYSAREKFQLGWISPAEVETVDQSGEYLILPLAQSTPGVKALRVRRPGTDGWFWIECREPGGTYETSLGGAMGAVVHYEDSVNRDSGSVGPPDLLDFTPQSQPDPFSDMSDAPLSPGRSWIDDWTGLQIAVTGEVTGSGLSVTIGQPGTPGCAVFSETSRRHTSAENTGTIQVIAPPDCTWSVSTAQSWVDSISPSSGRGNATMAYRVLANSTVKVRRAALALGNIFTIEQDGYGAYAVSLQPSSGTGDAQTFTYVFHDSGGFRDVLWVAAIFSQGSRYCSLYVSPQGEFTLQAEDSSSLTAYPGDQGLLENQNCSLDPAASSIEFNGNDLQIRAAMRFQGAFAGAAEIELWTFGQATVVGKYRMGFWTISAMPGALPAITVAGVVNAASFAGGGVAPGEIVSLFGSNLGPSAGVSNGGYDPNTGALPTALGEVGVSFDGQAAPLFFVRNDQINVQVPYKVAGMPSTSVVATYRGWASAAISVPVAWASPGVFQYNDRTLILDAMTGAIVDAAHPISRGGWVSIYATGAGLVDPNILTGKPAPVSPPNWYRSVQARIGGRDTPIDFAGMAPGFVGLLQINLQVPPDAATGANVPLELVVNGVAAQAFLGGAQTTALSIAIQ